MLEISNVKVYDLRESVIASGNAMRLEPVEYSDSEFIKVILQMYIVMIMHFVVLG